MRGLTDGTIDAICSDHTPVDEDGKELPFSEAEPGATGLELLLPLALKWGAEAKLPLAQTLARVTAQPARVLQAAEPTLAPGATADLCIFDRDAWWKVDAASLKSQGKNTPFTGYELQGRVRTTLVGGRIVFEP